MGYRFPMPAARRTENRSGEFRVVESGPDGYSAFHPAPLPPDPAVDIDPELQVLVDQANQALGRLDGITLLLPDPDQFLYTYVRKEAVLSSQIEGTQSSLSDLLLFEADAAPGVPVSDARETSNYIEAMNHGVEKIRSGELPLSNRLMREMHAVLLRSGRGSERSPGRFRREQNWIGGNRPAVARYVPPPWQEVEPAMAQLEKFLHDDPKRTPILVKVALAHAYLSLYLKQNRDDYYDHLQRIRTEGAWEAWLRFFLEGVIEVAESTTATTRDLVHMIERDRQAIHEFGRGAATALRVHDLASRFVVLRPADAAGVLGLSAPPVYGAVRRLEEAGILREVTGRQRGKLYVYDEYLARLNEGTTEPAS